MVFFDCLATVAKVASLRIFPLKAVPRARYYSWRSRIQSMPCRAFKEPDHVRFDAKPAPADFFTD